MTESTIRLSTSDERYQFTEQLKITFGLVPDFVVRKVGDSFVVYIAGLVDQKRIEREIIEPLFSPLNKRRNPCRLEHLLCR